MRGVKWIGLGIFIWGLSLLWPEINQLLRIPVMIGMSVALVAISLAYVLVQRLYRHYPDNGRGQDQPSRPVPLTALR